MSWLDALTWLEQSALGQAIRSAGVWTYAAINLVHILGIATLVGSVIVLDVKLLTASRTADLQSIVGATVPLTFVGFGLAVLSGLCMLATNGTDYATNPFLRIKFAAIAFAVLNTGMASRTFAWRSSSAPERSRRDQMGLRVIAGISLLCWLCAASAGRMIGYW